MARLRRLQFSHAAVKMQWPIFLLLSALLLSACTGAEPVAPSPAATTPASTLLNLGISDNAQALAEPWASAYQAETVRAHVNFVGGNNNTLFSDLEEGQLDAILVHHIPEGVQDDVWFNPVALDGLVIVVHADNPVTSLAQAEIQRLFSGETDNWSAVGGEDLMVAPIGQERGDGARTVFTRRLMGARPVSINTVIHSDSESLIEAVAAEPGAIGYTTMSGLAEGVQPVAVDGIAPTPENAASQDYPLTAPLYFVSNGEPQGELRAFLAWLQGAEGQSIVSEIVGSVR